MVGLLLGLLLVELAHAGGARPQRELGVRRPQRVHDPAAHPLREAVAEAVLHGHRQAHHVPAMGWRSRWRADYTAATLCPS